MLQWRQLPRGELQMRRNVSRLAYGGMVAVGAFLIPHLLVLGAAPAGIAVQFDESTVLFCAQNGGPLEHSIAEPSEADAFISPDHAAVAYVAAIRTAASADNPSLIDLAVSSQRMSEELQGPAYAPARDLVAPIRTEAGDDRHYFDKVSPEDGHTVRLVVEPIGDRYFVASSFICTSEIVELSSVDSDGIE